MKLQMDQNFLKQAQSHNCPKTALIRISTVDCFRRRRTFRRGWHWRCRCWRRSTSWASCNKRSEKRLKKKSKRFNVNTCFKNNLKSSGKGTFKKYVTLFCLVLPPPFVIWWHWHGHPASPLLWHDINHFPFHLTSFLRYYRELLFKKGRKCQVTCVI